MLSKWESARQRSPLSVGRKAGCQGYTNGIREKEGSKERRKESKEEAGNGVDRKSERRRKEEDR